MQHETLGCRDFECARRDKILPIAAGGHPAAVNGDVDAALSHVVCVGEPKRFVRNHAAFKDGASGVLAPAIADDTKASRRLALPQIEHPVEFVSRMVADVHDVVVVIGFPHRIDSGPVYARAVAMMHEFNAPLRQRPAQKVELERFRRKDNIIKLNGLQLCPGVGEMEIRVEHDELNAARANLGQGVATHVAAFDREKDVGFSEANGLEHRSAIIPSVAVANEAVDGPEGEIAGRVRKKSPEVNSLDRPASTLEAVGQTLAGTALPEFAREDHGSHTT